MIEDLIMEFDETPEGTAETLADAPRGARREIAEALAEIMVGLVEHHRTGCAVALTRAAELRRLFAAQIDVAIIQ